MGNATRLSRRRGILATVVMVLVGVMLTLALTPWSAWALADGECLKARWLNTGEEGEENAQPTESTWAFLIFKYVGADGENDPAIGWVCAPVNDATGNASIYVFATVSDSVNGSEVVNYDPDHHSVAFQCLVDRPVTYQDYLNGNGGFGDNVKTYPSYTYIGVADEVVTPSAEQVLDLTGTVVDDSGAIVATVPEKKSSEKEAANAAITTGELIDPIKILGDAAAFGIVADSLDVKQVVIGKDEDEKDILADGSIESNFAVGTFKTTAQVLLDYDDSKTYPFYLSNTKGTVRLNELTGDGAVAGDADFYVTEADATSGRYEINSKKDIQFIPTTVDSIDAYRNALSRQLIKSSDSLARKTTSSPSPADDTFTIDTTQLDDNKTIYLDASNMADALSSGTMTINKLPGQYLVFNIPTTDDVTITAFTVNVQGGKTGVSSVVDDQNADKEHSKDVDEVILDKICFNVSKATKLTVSNASGLILAPKAEKVTVDGGAGWIATTGAVTCVSPWHFYRADRAYDGIYSVDVNLSATKEIEGDTNTSRDLTFTVADNKHDAVMIGSIKMTDGTTANINFPHSLTFPLGLAYKLQKGKLVPVEVGSVPGLQPLSELVDKGKATVISTSSGTRIWKITYTLSEDDFAYEDLQKVTGAVRITVNITEDAKDGKFNLEASTNPKTAALSNKVVSKGPKTQSVNVIKVDSADGKALTGAVLQVLDANDNIQAEWRSGADPHEVRALAVGETYTLKETLAPQGYLQAKSITFSVDEKGKVTSENGTVTDDGVLQIQDTMTKVSIIRRDAKTNKALTGGRLQVLDSKGNVVAEWESTIRVHTIEGLVTGEVYTIHERVAPKNYKTAVDAAFVISSDGSIAYRGKVDESGALVIDSQEDTGGNNNNNNNQEKQKPNYNSSSSTINSTTTSSTLAGTGDPVVMTGLATFWLSGAGTMMVKTGMRYRKRRRNK